MAKILVSSLSLQTWMESFSEQEEYDLEIFDSSLMCENSKIDGDGKGRDFAVISRERWLDFIAILKHLRDQPIVIVIEGGRFWLWQAQL